MRYRRYREIATLGPKKAMVEESLVLTASTLVRRKSLVRCAQTFGSWGWTRDGEDEPHATIGYEANLTDLGRHGKKRDPRQLLLAGRYPQVPAGF